MKTLAEKAAAKAKKPKKKVGEIRTAAYAAGFGHGVVRGRKQVEDEQSYEERRYKMAEKLIEKTCELVDHLRHMMPYKAGTFGSRP